MSEKGYEGLKLTGSKGIKSKWMEKKNPHVQLLELIY